MDYQLFDWNAMPIWSTTPVDDLPELTISQWSVYETAAGDRHFVGWNVTEREGRVSSAIQEFDSVSCRGRTRSGRVYQLQGRPGHNADAEYTWRRWLSINGSPEVRDVTTEVMLAAPIQPIAEPPEDAADFAPQPTSGKEQE
jgi:hypothetical protein